MRPTPATDGSLFARLHRGLSRFLTGFDWLWALVPRRLQQSPYLSIQRAVARETRFQHRCARVFADGCVRAGPLQGLRYPEPLAVGSAYWPKVTGSYESELHGEIARLLTLAPPLIIDIGFAEGYYLVGLGRQLTTAKLVGYDISVDAHRLCTALARANGVAPERLHLYDAAERVSLQRYLPAPGLVISDCEGYEQALFAADLMPLWCRSHLIIECHDFLVPGVGDNIAARLQATHEVRWITTLDDADKLGFVAGLAFRDEEKRQLVAEGRPSAMRWIVAEPRAQVPGPGRTA